MIPYAILYQTLKDIYPIINTFHDGNRNNFLLNYLRQKGGKVGMNFNEMIKSLDNTKKAFRPTWSSGEFLWKKGNVLTHTTPYWGGEMINQYIDGYPYVALTEDIEATDWVVMDKIDEEKSI